MPGFDAVMSALAEKGAWWNSFQQKTRAIAQNPIEHLSAFAARAYTSSSPAVVGTLACAYARSLGGRHDIYAMVEALVISDFAHVATQDGLECLVLLAKSYTDIGQPRRAWLAWRKGLSIAQMMVRLQPLSPLVRRLSGQ